MKFGLFGGSFDPPHAGHVAVALQILERTDLDRIILCPVNMHEYKCAKVLPEERLEMLNALVREHPALEVNDIEMRMGGISLMSKTLVALFEEEAYQDCCMFLILSVDLHAEMSAWKGYDDLKVLTGKFKFIVYARRCGDDFLGFREGEEGLFLGTLGVSGLSSTNIRSQLQQGKRNVWGLSQSVSDVIFRKGLYGTSQ